MDSVDAVEPLRSQEIIAKPVNNREKTVTFNISSTQKFEAGEAGNEPKRLLKGTIDGNPVSFIERHYGEDFLENWQAFQEAGLPVPPELLEATVDGFRRLLITDVKADGSETYGKNLKKYFEVRKDIYPRVRPPEAEVDEHFLRLTSPNNFHLIETRARELSELAVQKGIKLPDDDAFELLVHPDGNWELIILDLMLGDTNPSEARANSEYTDNFLNTLRDVRKAMELQRRKSQPVWQRVMRRPFRSKKS